MELSFALCPSSICGRESLPHKLTLGPVHVPSSIQPPEAWAWLPSFLQCLSYLCVGRRPFQWKGLHVLDEDLRFAHLKDLRLARDGCLTSGPHPGSLGRGASLCPASLSHPVLPETQGPNCHSVRGGFFPESPSAS